MTQVIIDDIIPRTQLTASAGQTVFNTNWTADATTDVKVYARASGVDADDVTQIVSQSYYTVTFIGASQTVRVTFLSGRVLNDIITIVRDTPADRLNLYINTNFTPSMLNQDFGILTLVDQQAQMYDYVVNPGYNVSAIIEPVVDTVLPILDANQIWAMNPTRTAIIPYDVPAGGGLAPAAAKYILQQPNSYLPNAQSISTLASGLIVGTTTTGVLISRVLTGATDQIGITNASGILGNPLVYIVPNPVLSGSEGLGLPHGTTAQRPATPIGTEFRFNSSLEFLEYWDGSNWIQLSELDGVITATGTENQVLVNGTFGVPTDGDIILTLPQDIAPASNVTFASVATSTIKDSYGNTTFEIFSGPSVVNYLATTPNNTGGGPSISANGLDANINFFIIAKGTGVLVLDSQNTTPITINSGTGFQHTTNFIMANTNATRNVTFQDASGTLAYLSDIPSVIPSALTRVDDTNVTLTLGGSPSVSLLAATSLTLGWTGQLSGSRGGTGVNNGSSTFTMGGNVTFSGAFTFAGTVTGNTAVTFPTSGTLATTSQLVTPSALTKTDDTNVTLTLGGSPSTALVNAASLTLGWTGQLSVARGGTGISSFGTGVATALGINVGSAGAFVVNGGALGTPSSGTLTSCTGLPIAGITGLGTGVATALALSVNGSGALALTTSPTFVTPVLGVAAATSINFGGSALSTYSELQTWTPTISFVTPGDLTVTYGAQVGYYSRIGNIVSAHFSLTSATPTFTTASGFLRIVGFPFTANTNIGGIGSVQFQASVFPIGTTSLYLRIVANTSVAIVGSSGSTVAAAFMTATQCTSGAALNIVGSITYLV